MPIIHGFKATTIMNAFILNSLAIALVAAISANRRSKLDRTNMSDPLKTFVVFLYAFVTGLVSYGVLYMIFGFGGGMLAT